jgi:hypothetical protein
MNRTEPGLPAEQRTMRTENSIESIPGMDVCDFCTCTPVVASYPAGTVLIHTPAGVHATRDPWAACEHCYALIEADDRAGLVERSLGGFIAQEGDVPHGVLVEIRYMIERTQDGFFEVRQGEPTPL